MRLDTWIHYPSNTVMSAYSVPLKTRFGNAEDTFYKTLCICTEFISKTCYQKAFCYIQQSEFRSVKQSRMYRDSIQDCNIDLSTYIACVIYVEYRVVYRVVVSYMSRVL